MGCWYRPQLNAISSIWYCLCFLLLQGYLLYAGLNRYSALTDNGRKTSKDRPAAFLSLYITFHGLVIALLPIFAFSAIFKVGNLANDGERIGNKQRSVIHTSGPKCCLRLKACWIHGLPVSQTVHLIIATAFLVSSALVEAEYLGEDVHFTDELWFTELSLLKGTPIGHQGADQLVEWNTSERDFRNSGQLISVRTFGISLPFVNYISALVAFAIVYPSVFWRVNRTFSFIFSCHLMVHAAAAVFSFISYSTLRRIYLSGYADGSGHRSPFLLQEPYLFILYLSTAAIMLISSVVVYSYGYTKFCLSVLMKRGLYRVHRKVYAVYCDGYSPHIAAIVALVMMVLCKAPTLYDLMVLYQHHQQPVLLSCIVADICYLFSWILLWLGLTLKRDWVYNVQHSMTEIGNLLDLRTDESKECSDSTLIVVCKEYAFATDSDCKKLSITQTVEKCGHLTHSDIYWPKVQENDLHPDHVISTKPIYTKNMTDETITSMGKARQLEKNADLGQSNRRRINDSYTQIQGSVYESSRDLVTTFGSLPRSEKAAGQYLRGSNASLITRKDKGSVEGGASLPTDRTVATQYASVQRTVKQTMPVEPRVTTGKNLQNSEVKVSKQNSYIALPSSRIDSWDSTASGGIGKDFKTATAKLSTIPRHPYMQSTLPGSEANKQMKNPPPPSAVGPYSININTGTPLCFNHDFGNIEQSQTTYLTLDRLKLDKPQVDSSKPGASESKLNQFPPDVIDSRPSRNVAGSASDVMWNVNPLYRIQPNRNPKNFVQMASRSETKPITSSPDPLAHFSTSIV